MRIPENGKLLRIYIGESDRWHHQPLYEALVLKAREISPNRAVLQPSMIFGSARPATSAESSSLFFGMSVMPALLASRFCTSRMLNSAAETSLSLPISCNAATGSGCSSVPKAASRRDSLMARC